MGTLEMQIMTRPCVIGGIPRAAARGTERPEADREAILKPSDAANDNLIDRTREVWKVRLGRDLSREDARQIVENVTGFFAILTEWSRAEMPVPANDTAKPLTSDAGEATGER
jgi:hypothetical protein